MKINFMNARNLIIGWAVLSVFAPNANGAESASGLFVEPSITYELGTTAVNYPSPLSSSSGTAEGIGIGARFGFHISEAFFLGVDARYAMPQYKDSSVTYEAKSISTSWGPVVGMQMPNLGLRLWGSYILGGFLDPEKSGNFDVKFEKLSGYRIGAGFRLSAVSLNLEYQLLKYGQTVLEQLGPFSSGSTLDGVNLDNKAWIASVSFPLEF